MLVARTVRFHFITVSRKDGIRKFVLSTLKDELQKKKKHYKRTLKSKNINKMCALFCKCITNL